MANRNKEAEEIFHQEGLFINEPDRCPPSQLAIAVRLVVSQPSDLSFTRWPGQSALESSGPLAGGYSEVTLGPPFEPEILGYCPIPKHSHTFPPFSLCLSILSTFINTVSVSLLSQ